MPECGSQIILCELPIRFDTYRGCSHRCSYCFARKKWKLERIELLESPNTLKNFIDGKRSRTTEWCDWDIPLHWGGMSDPFQPADKMYKVSYECLKIFAETGYPFVFSSKGKLMADPEYLAVMKDCNVVSQVSLVSAVYDKLEPGAPSFEERMGMLDGLSKNTKRLIIRVSPYSTGLADDVCASLKRYKDAGVFGIEIEGMKSSVKKSGTVRVAGDSCYPVDVLQREYQQIKEECVRLGLAFYCGENRLRWMSDDTCCCGVVGVPGFVSNRANLNRLVVGENIEYTEKMRASNTATCFRTLVQSTVPGRVLQNSSYAEIMDIAARTRPFLKAMGILDTE